MQKIIFLILFILSIICSALNGLYLLLIVSNLLITGGTYSQTFTTEDGGSVMACNISIFAQENWLWTTFEVLGVPGLILLATIRTAQVLYRRLL